MSEKLKLFGEFERTDAAPAKYTESLFDALNRLSWNNVAVIRTTLEEWFSVYPESNKTDLQNRFRSKRDSDHQGAFFELVLFKLLSELGYEITVNGPILSGAPDFLARALTGEQFYLEATVALPKTFRDGRSEKALFDELNKVNCPDFWLCIRTRGTLSSTPPMRRTIRDIQAWIDSLDYKSVHTAWSGSRQLPTYTIKHHGWTLFIEALPRGPDVRGKKPHRPIGLGPIRVEKVDSVKPVVSAVHEKAKKYPNLGAPLIVAVNALDLAGVDRTDTLEALFGWESSTDNPSISRVVAPQGVRKEDHIWDTDKNTSRVLKKSVEIADVVRGLW